MKTQPKLTVSGYRGIWGESLNEEIASFYIESFAIFLQKRNAKKILIGRDARISGPEIVNVAKKILTESGIDVIDGGLLPTPTVLYLVRTMKFDGALMITASHNPPQYNGIKFITDKALFTNEEEVAEISENLGKKSVKKNHGTYTKEENLGTKHINHIVENVNKDLIKEQKYTVVLDAINSVGSYLGPMLLEKLGCTVYTLNGTPDGKFAHTPEPLAENLTDLAEKVKEYKADIGFALDPDGDRLVVCDEKGVVVFEEYTLSLAIKAILAKTPGDIVTNLSTTNTNKDLVEETGFKNFRTKVGEANVVAGIVEHNAVIGGEGGGGVIYPQINLCRDGFTGMALILESLAISKHTVSHLVGILPHYEFIKTKIPFSGNIKDIIEKMKTHFEEGVADTQDGLKVDMPDGSWIQIRASNTEPIIRIFAEAKTKEKAEQMIEDTKKIVEWSQIF